MKFLKRYNEGQIIKATNSIIKEILKEEINKLGNDADLNHIDVSGVTTMSKLFHWLDFNGDISQWNVENVKNMKSMFMYCKFNGDIVDWNVENVTNMDGMFRISKFDGDISNWNVEKVTNMKDIFRGSQFSGDLNKWRPLSLNSINEMSFYGSKLQGKEPLWFLFLRWKLFNSGEDYIKSIERFGWLSNHEILIVRLWTAIEFYEGNIENIGKITKIKDFKIRF